MSLLILNVEGSPHVQAVALDDPSPSYAPAYAAEVKKYLDPDAVLRYALVDVTPVSEYGPNDVATMLTGNDDWVLDISQTWEVA